MAKPENHAPSNFQKLYDSLTVTEKLSVDSIVNMYFVLFQSIQDTFARQIQQNQDRKN